MKLFKEPRRLPLFLLGLLFLAVTFIDYEGRRWDFMFCGGGLLCLALSLLWRQEDHVVSAFLVLASAYFGLVIVAVAFYQPGNLQKDYRGIYQEDPARGFRLTPSWKGDFGDGVVHGHIQINSQGFRDEELRATTKKRVLLLGNSYAFGHLLDQTETIDKRVEETCGIDAYNMGVLGYGLPSILETYRGIHPSASRVFYLFFMSDLREENTQLVGEYSIHDGYLVPRHNHDGRALSTTEQDELIKQELGKRGYMSVLKLTFLRDILTYIAVAKGNLGGPQGTLWGSEASFNKAFTQKAVDMTVELNRLTRENDGQGLTVVVIPTIGETRFNSYAKPTSEFLGKLRGAGIDVIEPIRQLNFRDYFNHDGHLAPTGADKAARMICEYMQKVGS